MEYLPLSAKTPPGATDFAVGITASRVAFFTDHAVVLRDGECVLVPNGWELAHDLHNDVLIVYFDHNTANEVTNA